MTERAGGHGARRVVESAPVKPLTSGDPTRLGPYVLTGKLGEGGMGRVYLARNGDGRQVAVKVVRPEFAREDEFRARFRRETAAARRVAQSCTAAVLDADPDADEPYLVTEYVPGPTLARAVGRGGPLPPSDVEQLAISMATALTQIHRAGVVHRDLKPSNVLLSPLGPRVIDFGIARALDMTTMLSGDLQRLGTPAYMAPEQVEGAEPTPAIDIFAWAGLLVFAATGSPPFGDGPVVLLPYRILKEQPTLDGVGDALRPIVARAFDKDPANRPSATDLLMDLLGDRAAVAQATGVVLTPPDGVTRPASSAAASRSGVTPPVGPAVPPPAAGQPSPASANWWEASGGGSRPAAPPEPPAARPASTSPPAPGEDGSPKWWESSEHGSPDRSASPRETTRSPVQAPDPGPATARTPPALWGPLAPASVSPAAPPAPPRPAAVWTPPAQASSAAWRQPPATPAGDSPTPTPTPAAAPASASAWPRWGMGGAAAVLVGSFLPFISSISLVGGDVLPRARTVSAIFGVVLLGLTRLASSRTRTNRWSALLAAAGILGVLGYGGFIALGYAGVTRSDTSGVQTELTFRPNIGLITCVVGCAICAGYAIAALSRRRRGPGAAPSTR